MPRVDESKQNKGVNNNTQNKQIAWSIRID